MTLRNGRAAIAKGSLAGTVGTVVMSAVMLFARRAGLVKELPPERITASLLNALGLHERGERTQDALAALLHMVFGATGGALFALLHRWLRVPIAPAAQGVIYGGLVWLVNYMGWVPALGIMPTPAHDEPRRPMVMVIAHCIYGGVLGAIVGQTSRES